MSDSEKSGRGPTRPFAQRLEATLEKTIAMLGVVTKSFPDEDVREAAAEAVDRLHDVVSAAKVLPSDVAIKSTRSSKVAAGAVLSLKTQVQAAFASVFPPEVLSQPVTVVSLDNRKAFVELANGKTLGPIGVRSFAK